MNLNPKKSIDCGHFEKNGVRYFYMTTEEKIKKITKIIAKKIWFAWSPAWDKYSQEKGADIAINKRPECNMNNNYALLLMENGGTDLESYLTKESVNPSQCYSIFYQEIYIRSYGGHASIIDFTNSRTADTNRNNIIYNKPSEDIFNGNGDYQFDIYRMMKDENNDIYGGCSAQKQIYSGCIIFKENYLIFPIFSQSLQKERIIAGQLADMDIFGWIIY
ncbi:Protein kinase domain-containing protein [Meloidogyne graminicola]|uniref:Protein kinase domain-containing protein n=1 Tax=Meloidogyne graminicola TaxID=189291 RepID=A0A8S9ZS70_9BILA|nr:Protein kinase domain-containing protein [Meloidogyne graminicola]